MNKTDLIELAERCEAAGAGDQYPLLVLAGEHVFGKERIDWPGRSFYTFRSMLDCRAFLDAAMTLVPEGWVWAIDSNGRASAFKPNAPKPWPRVGGFNGDRPALALTAAALRALAQTKGE